MARRRRTPRPTFRQMWREYGFGTLMLGIPLLVLIGLALYGYLTGRWEVPQQ